MHNSISYIIPILNEEENLDFIVERIKKSFENNKLKSYEIIFVDDGSTDHTLKKILKLIKQDHPVKCISLTRNFGHQAALTAGFQNFSNDLVAVLDGDLQDPPEILNEFINYIDKGYDIVYGVRTKRKENLFKKLSYSFFYKILKKLSYIDIPVDTGDFCLMTKVAVDKINELPEKNRFIRGLRAYVGLSQIGIEYERQERFKGSSKYSLKKLLILASDGIFNFSDKPLKITSSLGVLLSILSFFLMLCLIMQRLFSIEILGYSPNEVPGYTSLIISNIFLSGIQLFALGIIGEYISRIFLETKKRPSFFIREIIDKKNIK